LYCDITGKAYDEDATIEIKSLDAVLLSRLRNDLAFIINETLVVILEHQSTLNKNMPLRSLQYVLLFYEIYFKLGNALYKEKLIKLPKPEFYVLYNGQKPYPLRGILRLSDAFIGLEANEQPALELIVNVINIDYGDNVEVLEKNADLKGYSIFVAKIRERQKEGRTLAESIQIAMKECLSEGILTEILEKHKNEVNGMFSLVYDEEKAIQIAREEALEDGIELGRKETREENRLNTERIARLMLADGKPLAEVAKYTCLPIGELQELR
jgi:predicted transposase YdaD